MDDVVAVVVEREAAVGEADHSVGVGVLAGQQAGAAPRTGRSGAEGLAEDDTLLGQTLDVGRPDSVSVGPDPPARVVGVDVEDVRKFPQFLPPLRGLGGRALVVQADPLLGEIVRLPLHSRLLDGEVLGNRNAYAVEQPQHGPLVVLDQLLVDYLQRLHATLLEEALPGGVVLVDAQLEVVHGGEAETQAPSAGLLVGVPTPLLGLERLPKRDRLARGVLAPDP